MRLRSNIGSLVILSALATFASEASAQITIPSDGSDGDLMITANTTIDLSLAPTGVWSDPSPSPGNGIYDPDLWAVVFKYGSVTVDAGRTVTFTNHPSRAPVVWLIQNDATINGAVNLTGAAGVWNGTPVAAEPGPGGFRGGMRDDNTNPPSAGFGPGGGAGPPGTGTDHGDPASNNYGNAALIPLIGGSGGAGGQADFGFQSQGGGAGGGAILIAAGGTLTIAGSISANGGSASGSSCCGSYAGGQGSGGGIRLLADVVTGNGTLSAVRGGGSAGDGRIRIEANTISLAALGSPSASLGVPAIPPRIWPDMTDPAVRLLTLGGLPLPADPRAEFSPTNADVTLLVPGMTEVIVETMNVPTDAMIEVRSVGAPGGDEIVPATLVGGNTTLATWSAMLTMTGGASAFQARVILSTP